MQSGIFLLSQAQVKNHTLQFVMSDFWVSKMRTFFRRFDADNDGVYSNEDVELMAERFGEIADDDRKKTLRETLFQV